MSKEIFLGDNELIVSKTDLKGIIKYVNSTFLKITGYTEDEVIGKPHNIIRHPCMPKCVFKLLWDVLRQKKEVFAYVINYTKHHDYYWVFAHVTPSFDSKGDVVGYHSNRRLPNIDAVKSIASLYEDLQKEEQKHSNSKEGCSASFAMLMNILNNKGVSYDKFILTL